MLSDKIFNLLSSAKILDLSPWNASSIIWREKGLAIRKKFINLISSTLNSKKYEEYLLPAFIPDTLLKKQEQHYKDIIRISFYLGDDIGCYLRATSESQFASIVSSKLFEKIPIRMFQVCSVYRREPEKNLFPIIRSIEIDPFIETMTFTQSSSNEIRREVKIYKKILKKLCIPSYETIRPRWDTFPEATLTYAFDTMVGSLGITQVATIHNLATSFPRAFSLTSSNGSLLQHTSSGISGRALLASMIVHSKDGMIFLPSSLCPKTIAMSEHDYKIIKKQTPTLETKDVLILNDKKYKSNNPVIPLHLEINNRGIEIVNAFGERYYLSQNNFFYHFKCILNEFDDELLKRAISKNEVCNDENKIVTEFPSCGKLQCLCYDALNSIDKQLLGFVRLNEKLGHCLCCKSQQHYLARFAKAI